jgi:hypothetical protein
MGIPSSFSPEKLVVAVLLSGSCAPEAVLQPLTGEFGPADFVSPEVPFTFTRYYEAEMGAGLRRLFISFRTLVDPSRLSLIKASTNGMEDAWSDAGARRFNLDPGLLSLSRFVLATTKESSHRIPLSNGIYAEVTLIFQAGSFRPLPWTYPDYRSQAYLDILNGIRARHKAGISRQ